MQRTEQTTEQFAHLAPWVADLKAGDVFGAHTVIKPDGDNRHWCEVTEYVPAPQGTIGPAYIAREHKVRVANDELQKMARQAAGVYDIIGERWDEFTRKFAALAKRAAKLGVPAITYDVVGYREEPVMGKIHVWRPVDDNPNVTYLAEERGPTGRYHTWVQVKLNGTELKLADWDFLGTLEWVAEAKQNILHAKPSGEEVDISAYRNAPPKCDHCKTRRMRKETFLVRSTKTGELVQVGRQCIRDYLGHDAEKIARALTYLRSFEAKLGDEDEGWGGGGMRVPYSMNTRWFLAVVAAVVRQKATAGFVSKGRAYERNETATATEAMSWVGPDKHKLKWLKANGFDHQPTPADYELADEMIACVRAVSEADAEGNGYLTNMRVVFVGDSFTLRNQGLVASAYSMLKRHKEYVAKQKAKREAEKAQAANPSQHVGTVGQRGEFAVTIDRTHWFEGNYGPTCIVAMRDADNNVLKTFATGKFGDWADENVGERCTIKATVRNHDEYKGVAETVVNRVARQKD